MSSCVTIRDADEAVRALDRSRRCRPRYRHRCARPTRSERRRQDDPDEDPGDLPRSHLRNGERARSRPRSRRRPVGDPAVSRIRAARGRAVRELHRVRLHRLHRGPQGAHRSAGAARRSQTGDRGGRSGRRQFEEDPQAVGRYAAQGGTCAIAVG